MPTTLAARPTFVVDRAGHPRFINRTAATLWLTAAHDGRALQCADCTEIHDTADDAFGCCGTGAAYPVRPTAYDPHLFETVPADDLKEPPMYKIWSYGRDDWMKFPTLDAAKAYMQRLYTQGLIRGSHTELVYGPNKEHITLHLSFGVVMERRSTAAMAQPIQQPR